MKNNKFPLFSNFRGDIIAGLSVALVALPLGLGIAMASGFPPISGIISAAVGGLFAWMLGGTYVGIKGPANGSIVVLGAAIAFYGGGENGIPYVLACISLSGVLLFITGILKLGKYAELLPTSAINGLLAGIGFIIIAKQVDEFFGYVPQGLTPFENFKEIPYGIMQLNPIVTCMSIISILVLLWHAKSPFKLVRRIPAAIWVLLLSLPWVLFFDMQHAEHAQMFGWKIDIRPDFLVQLPHNVLKDLKMPSLDKIGNGMFWIHGFSIFIILLVENLLSAKAVDKMDPLNRKTNLNKDLASSGLVTFLSSLIGGIPSITVIIRSSVNVGVGGKQRLSNIAHGVILVVFLFYLVEILNLVPKAALASILVFTGFRLCSPLKFKEVFEKGWEQLLIFFVAFYFTITSGLVSGIVAGTLFDFFIEYVLSGMSLKEFWTASRNPRFIVNTENNHTYSVLASGVINFLGVLKMQKVLNRLPEKSTIAFNFGNAKMIDHTALELVHATADVHEKKAGIFSITGLEKFHSSSPHTLSMRFSDSIWKRNQALTRRQQRLKDFCQQHGYSFNTEIITQTGHYQTFPVFSTRPPTARKNTITGKFQNGTQWQLADLTFHEGEWVAQNELNTTLITFTTPCPIPVFSLEPEMMYDRLREFAQHRDITLQNEQLDKKIVLKGTDEGAVTKFFNSTTSDYILSKQETYYIDSNGSEILIFETSRYATEDEIPVLIEFASGLHQVICSINAQQQGVNL